jgi:leucyl-tRNA synthetase
LIANDLVDEKDGKFFHKETWEELKQIVAKMSKSLKNVVNPDDIVNEYWADALRLYEMYMSDFKDSAPWDTKNIVWVSRFLDKVWNLFENGKLWVDDEESMKLLHKTIKKIWEDIENYKFNTAIASLMILVNYWTPKDENKATEWKKVFAQLLHPFAPHIAEELWSMLGNKDSIFNASWPKYDSNLVKDDVVVIWVQVLWKLRWEIEINVNDAKEDIISRAKEVESVKKWLEGKEILKEIYVPGKIVNIVVK